MTLHVDVLIGISFGVLVGVLPAFVVGAVSAGATYLGVDLKKIVSVGVALPLAGVNAYAVGLLSGGPAAVPRLVVAGIVVVLLALYANSQGAALAERFPRDLSAATRSDRTFSAAALDDVDGSGEVVLTTTGTVADVDGHPPLQEDLRSALEAETWRVPADLPLSEIEARLADRLETEYDLSAVSVSVDDRARLAIAAAPPSQALAERVQDGWRAVAVDALVPTGVARGDEVTVSIDDAAVSGTILDAPAASTDDGRGGVTIAMPADDAKRVLDPDDARITVSPRDGNPAFEAFSHLRQAGNDVRKVELTPRSRERIADASDELEVVCVRSTDADADDAAEWQFDPDAADVQDGGEAFLVGPNDDGTLPSIVEAATANRRGETS